MGYYTELKFSCQLSKDAPLDILEKLCNNTIYKEITGHEQPSVSAVDETPNLPINHPFGKTHRWDQIFGSFNTKFNKERKTLKIHCDIKAYENDYEKLIDWLKPFIISGSAKYKGEEMDNWRKLL